MDKIKYTDYPKEGELWDVAIIGSGPAALTAAVYTTRGAASTILFAGDTWGGQLMLTTEVDNYPGFPEGIQGPELMQKMRDQAERFSTKIIDKRATEVIFEDDGQHKIKVGNDEYPARSVILATGADTKWLEVPGEERLRGRGVSSCAPCDAPFFKEKEVMVVGGGDSAMEEALVLTKYASKVTVIHRRDELAASEAMQKRFFEAVDEGKANVLWDTEVVEMLGDQKLDMVKLKTKAGSDQASKLKDGGFDEHNGEVEEEDSEQLYWQKPLDGVFVAIGHTPSTDIFKGKLELDEKGYLKRYEKDGYRTATSRKGVFVAGDVHDFHYRQAITAAGFGCMAGMDVLHYLDKPTPSW